jgi:small subunit ribosomal protein S17
LVVSASMDKSAVVSVKRRVKHSRYHKFIELSTKFMVHDQDNECEVGDRVLIMESRPLSKRKRWRLSGVLEKAIKDVSDVG